MATTGDRFERAVQIMRKLRAPDGCPWDREQTFDSIKQYTLEETYEVMEAIELRDFAELPQELGDLLLQVLFYAEMAQEEQRFSIDTVLDTLCEKLIRRHPHVFANVEAETPSDVLRNWEAIKKQERAAKDERATEEKPLLSSVSTAMPALMESLKLSNKAAHVGFDWPNIQSLFEKVQEEISELQAEVHQIPDPGPIPVGRGTVGRRQAVPADLQARLQDEVGDLFFALVNVARYLNVDPESALRGTNRKFRKRFGVVEQRLRGEGKTFEQSDIDEMERYWQESKGSGKS